MTKHRVLAAVFSLSLLSGCATLSPAAQDSWGELVRTVTSWPISVFPIGRTNKSGAVRVGLGDHKYDMIFGKVKGFPLDGMTKLNRAQTYVIGQREGVVVVNGVTSECENSIWIAHYTEDNVEIRKVPCQPFNPVNLITDDDRYLAMPDPGDKSPSFFAYDMKRHVLFKVEPKKEETQSTQKTAEVEHSSAHKKTKRIRTANRNDSSTAKTAQGPASSQQPENSKSVDGKPETKATEQLHQMSSYKMGSVHLEEVEVKKTTGVVVWDI